MFSECQGQIGELIGWNKWEVKGQGNFEGIFFSECQGRILEFVDLCKVNINLASLFGKQLKHKWSHLLFYDNSEQVELRTVCLNC